MEHPAKIFNVNLEIKFRLQTWSTMGRKTLVLFLFAMGWSTRRQAKNDTRPLTTGTQPYSPYIVSRHCVHSFIVHGEPARCRNIELTLRDALSHFYAGR